MVFDDRMRAAIIEKLGELIGHEEAAALLERIHPDDWSQLATKTDLAELREELLGENGRLRAEFDAMRGDLDAMRGDLDGMRGDLDGIRTEMRAGFARVDERLDLKLEVVEHRLAGQVSELRIDMGDAMRDLFVRMIAVMIPAIFSGLGLAFAAAKLA